MKMKWIFGSQINKIIMSNFQELEVIGSGSETQLQVGEIFYQIA